MFITITKEKMIKKLLFLNMLVVVSLRGMEKGNAGSAGMPLVCLQGSRSLPSIEGELNKENLPDYLQLALGMDCDTVSQAEKITFPSAFTRKLIQRTSSVQLVFEETDSSLKGADTYTIKPHYEAYLKAYKNLLYGTSGSDGLLWPIDSKEQKKKDAVLLFYERVSALNAFAKSLQGCPTLSPRPPCFPDGECFQEPTEEKGPELVGVLKARDCFGVPACVSDGDCNLEMARQQFYTLFDPFSRDKNQGKFETNVQSFLELAKLLSLGENKKATVEIMADHPAKKWLLQQGEKYYKKKSSPISFFCKFSPSGNYLLKRSVDYFRRYDTNEEARETKIRLCSAHDGSCIFSKKFNGDCSFSVSPDDRFLCVCHGGECISIVDIKSRERVAISASYLIGPVQFSPDSTFFIATQKHDGMTCLHNMSSRIKAFKADVIAFSPDSKYLAARVENVINIMDVQTGQIIHSLKHSKSHLKHSANLEKKALIEFSPDSRYCATNCWDDTVKIWDIKTGKHICSLGFDKPFSSSAGYKVVLFSPDSLYCATNFDNKTINIWDVQSGDLIRTIQEKYYHGGFSPCGKFFLVTRSLGGMGNYQTALINLQSGKSFCVQGEISGHDNRYIKSSLAEKEKEEKKYFTLILDVNDIIALEHILSEDLSLEQIVALISIYEKDKNNGIFQIPEELVGHFNSLPEDIKQIMHAYRPE